MGGSVASTVARVGADAMTFGTNELAGNPTGKIAGRLFGGSNNPSAPQMNGYSNTQMLEDSGGGPLLAQIAMGVDPKTAMAGFFGVNPSNFDQWLTTQDQATQSALQGLQANLTSISNNTDLKTKAVTQLTQNYPSMMQNLIPQYTDIMDKRTAQAAQQALDQVSAKYAANGGLSSGANAAAQALTAANMEQGNLQMGTSLAQTDWNQQYNNANALLQFQQKMMGQQAQQGMSAFQNMINANTTIGQGNAGRQFQQGMYNQEQQGALYSGLGALGGTLLGRGLFGGLGGSSGGTAPGSPSMSPSMPPPSQSGYMMPMNLA